MCAAGSWSAAAAQEELPQINPGERKVPRKKEAGPRAVGVLEMSANGKTALVPVAILVNGKFWDASAYKADPIPMALETGTVYEAERTGSSLGLFTVSSALHRNSPNLPDPWMGTGKWVPKGTDTSKTERKAEDAPVGLDPSDQPPPRLTRDASKVWQPASAPSANTPPPATKSDSGDEPPKLKKAEAASSAPPSAPNSGQTGSTTDTKAPDTKTPEAKAGDAKKDEAANVPASDSGATEANRPLLRRGKQNEALPDETVPGYSTVKPGSAAAAGKDAKGAKADAAAKSDVIDTVPAISDASGPDPHPFKFEWLKGEEQDRRDQMVAAAKDQVRSYLAALAKARIATPANSRLARRAPAKGPEPILENVKMVAYDLWNTNQPVIVFSAEAHMPAPPAGAAFSEVENEMRYSVVIVAYPDTYNNLHKIYAGVTDKFHLDITPRLELVDAVDADGDRRGELLFREISDGGSGWVIYRASADKLWKMFDSLRPE